MSTMSSEQFFLKWNNFESNLASGFADLLQKETMVDVTIAAEGKIIQAHKIILSICSPYFKHMFQVNPCQHPIVVLKDVKYQELTDMLDFMYKGEANVRQEDLPSFLKLAETLKVKGLAVNQGELEESSIKKASETQISNVTKNPSPFIREEPTNELADREDRDVVARKKTKRCSSPLAYPEPRGLPQSPPIIKTEVEECDNNFMRTNVNTNGRNPFVKEERLSDSSMDSYGENHVPNESWRIDNVAGRSTVEENSEFVQQDYKKVTRDYSFLESPFGKRLLILDGNSFRKKSTGRGGKSYWVCCDQRCSAKGILLHNGFFRLSLGNHEHAPNVDKIRRKEELLEMRKLALQVDVPGKEILKALDIKDDVKNLRYISTCRSRRKKGNRLAQVYVGLNYKTFRVRNSKNRLLRYSGYSYRKDSSNPKDELCQYWRCRYKGCKARAKTDASGNLTLLQPLHDHPCEDSSEEPKNRKKYTRRSRREKVPVPEVVNPDFCTDLYLDKLIAETLDRDYSEAPEFSGTELNLN